MKKDELPILLFPQQRDWEDWLEKNGRASPGAWLRIGKKGSSTQSLSYAQALETALCYGWIDGQKRAEDDKFWQQKVTPRGRKSIWSKINRAKALALIEAGRMTPAGLDEIERAEKDGRWMRRMTPPARPRFRAISRRSWMRILYRYIQNQKPALLFATRTGVKITNRSFLRGFKHLCNELGIAGVRCSAHTLWHTFAISYLRAGGNIYYLSRIVGHSSVKTTELYLRFLGIEDLKAVHERFSLLAKR